MARLSEHTGHGDSDESHTGIENGSGRLFVISAPSGAGKSTLCRALLAHNPDLNYSISYTSRKPRGQERDGVEYHFISEDEFERGIESGRWAEWARVHGNYYGTSAADLQRQLARGSDVLLDIDVEGTRQIRKRFPESVTIFIMPPSMAALEQRLRQRGTDSETEIRRRLQNAQDEMRDRGMYRHVIVNDRLPQATAELIELIDGYRRQASQQH
jgi:guanylate kinase